MQTLEQWLEVATRGLCAAAAERVRAEIGEHYLSAIESAGALDVDSPDAERLAIAALGDAKIANRQYRRVLLTEGEARRLSGLTSRVPNHLLSILVLATMAIIAISVKTYYVFAAMAVETMLRALPISSKRAGWVVRIFRWGNQTVFYAMWVANVLRVVKVPTVLTLILILPMVLGAVHTEYRLFVLRRKVPVDQWPRRLWI